MRKNVSNTLLFVFVTMCNCQYSLYSWVYDDGRGWSGPQQLIDGDTSTYWNSAYSAPSSPRWTVFQFQFAVKLDDNLTLWNMGDTTHDVKVFELHYSDNPSGPWSVLNQWTAATGSGWQYFDINPDTQTGFYKYWRLWIISSHTMWQPQPREIIFHYIIHPNSTMYPTPNPSKNPTLYPTQNPTKTPTANPTKYPTNNPTLHSSQQPTTFPSVSPTTFPTMFPTKSNDKEIVDNEASTTSIEEYGKNQTEATNTNQNTLIIIVVVIVFLIIIGALLVYFWRKRIQTKKNLEINTSTELETKKMTNDEDIVTAINETDIGLVNRTNDEDIITAVNQTDIGTALQDMVKMTSVSTDNHVYEEQEILEVINTTAGGNNGFVIDGDSSENSCLKQTIGGEDEGGVY